MASGFHALLIKVFLSLKLYNIIPHFSSILYGFKFYIYNANSFGIYFLMCVRNWSLFFSALFIWISYSFTTSLNWYICADLRYHDWIWAWAEVLHITSSQVLLFAFLHLPFLTVPSGHISSFDIFIICFLAPSITFLGFFLLSFNIWPGPLASISKVHYKYFHLSPFLSHSSIPS